MEAQKMKKYILVKMEGRFCNLNYDVEGYFSNKRKAVSEMHRIAKLQKASNELRKAEGSKERKHFSFAVLDSEKIETMPTGSFQVLDNMIAE